MATGVLLAATFAPMLTAFAAYAAPLPVAAAAAPLAPVAPAQPVPSQPSLPVVAPVVTGLNAFDGQLLTQINAKRAAAGAPALEEAKGLTTQSQAWSTQMANGATANKLAHNPDSLNQTLTNGASTRLSWGENVARWTDSNVSADAVLNGYWNSSLNKANLLDKQFKYVGIASVTGANGSTWNTLTFTDKVDAGQTYDPALRNIPLGQLAAATLTGNTVRIQGWGYDPNTATAPIQVQLKDISPDGSVVTSTVTADVTRTDIAAQYPNTGDKHGFDATIAVKNRGAHQICATLINAGAGTTNADLGCLGVTVTGVYGSYDSIEKSGATATLTGWTVDPDAPNTATTVVVTDNGPQGTVTHPAVTATIANANVDAAIPGVGAAHGFTATVPLAGVGVHTLCATGVAVRDGSTVDLGCKTVEVLAPKGVQETVSNTTKSVTISGWAVDPEAPQTASTVKVTVKVPGAAAITPAPVTANLPSASAAAAFPAGGNNHGYSVTVPFTGGGTFSACSVAVSTIDPNVSTDLGCKDFTVADLVGNNDKLTVANGILTSRGWGADKTLPTQAVDVKLVVTGPAGTAEYTVRADQARADIDRVFPGLGVNHGFLTQIPSAGKGVNQVCASFVSPSGVATKTLNCLTVTVP